MEGETKHRVSPPLESGESVKTPTPSLKSFWCGIFGHSVGEVRVETSIADGEWKRLGDYAMRFSVRHRSVIIGTCTNCGEKVRLENNGKVK